MLNNIITKKYFNEISILKQLTNSEDITDENFVDIIALYNKNNAVSIVNKLGIDKKRYEAISELIDKIFSYRDIESFLSSITPRNFSNDKEVIEYLESQKYKINFSALTIFDLFSTSYKENFKQIIKIIFDRNIKGLIEDCSSSFNLAEVKLKDHSISGKYSSKLSDFHKCFVKIVQPFISIYDSESLEEILTTRLDNVEIKGAINV